MSENLGLQTLDTPLGARLEVWADADSVAFIFFRLTRRTRRDRPNALTRKTARQLDEYFAGQRKAFSLPLGSLSETCSSGTDYRRAVWRALLTIPYGQTRTYSEIADQAGGGARSVGNANGRNPLCIIVPCHRVVRKDGLGGYGGPQTCRQGARLLEIKRLLLEHEQRHA